MIHQHIFASPRPGMTEAEFQHYWSDIHAVQYASRIPQILIYKLGMRLDWAGEVPAPNWSGFAEIWLRNEQEQIASLQSPEFLEGARRDEPNWAAFWNTLVLDTDTHPVLDRAGTPLPTGSVKIVVLLRRKPGMSVAAFRRYHLAVHAPELAATPGLLRCDVCFTRDSYYAIGEARFDAVHHLWFEDVATIERLCQSPEHRRRLLPDDGDLFDLDQVFHMVAREQWIIGPEPRA